jgi:GTP-binding protein EngB required for normal cell division
MSSVPPPTARGAGVAPDIDKLKAYTKAKQAVAREVRSLKQFLTQQGDPRGADACHELIVRLAEDRFNLAVLGQFKRGKSSLMNAVIGRDLLPTGVLPLTSAITVLRFGPQERLVIYREGSRFTEEAPAWRLAEYVTEKGNPGNRMKIKAAHLELPLELLRRGLEFVDTPGVGSAIEANTATTYGFLPQCDAVVLVTSVETPLTKAELEFVARIREHVRKVFFVLNKMDLLAGAERDEVLRFVSDTLRAHTGEQAIRLFPLSSRLGLAAKMAGDLDAYAASGLKAFEEALAEFLSSERAATSLGSVLDKALRLLTDAAPKDAGAQATQAALTRRMEALGRRLPRLEIAVGDGEMPGLAQPTPSAVAVQQPEQPPSVVAETDLAQDLRTRGCPVCQFVGKTAADFFAHWQYALSSEEAAQTAFTAELGFCPLHTWQLFAMSSSLGISLGYPRLLERLSSDLSRAAGAPAPAGALPCVPDARNCRVCGLLRQAERAYVQRLGEFVRTAEGRQIYARSQGICLRHLRLLVEAVASQDVVEFLLTQAARRFEEVAEDMQGFAVKWEAIRRTLHNRDEEDAYARAVVHVVGESRVCIPWRQDGDL